MNTNPRDDDQHDTDEKPKPTRGEPDANPPPPTDDPTTAEHVHDTSGTIPQRRSDAPEAP